ncbi:hypothetical protein F4818DRAFT_409587 [Hypoxylon cercidicola]|nr:hypothetical protein F4818DRAFT_409587 [Hypoxylon cercidicola]
MFSFRNTSAKQRQTQINMNGGSGNPASIMPQQCEFRAALDNFKRTARLTKTEEAEFQITSLKELQDCVQTIQKDQERKKRMMYMKRLDPFLQTMEQYGKVIDVFVNSSELLAFVWGPMKFILIMARTFSDALNSVLDAYQDIGEQIPLLEGYRQFLVSNSHMKTVLSLIYQDILEFHREAIKHFKQRLWKQLFQATWRGFTDKIHHLKKNLERHRRLIESHATIVEFEEIQRIRESARRDFEFHQKAENDRRRLRVMEWLSPFSAEDLQDRYRETRSICGDTGRWLLDDSRFQKWFSPDHCQTPSLWINGIPGAGKTILASVIVDEARGIGQASTIFFYCKYGDSARNTFISAARSLLAQLLVQNDHILQPLYERSSMSGEVMLTSKMTAKDLLRTALKSCAKTYIILDGLDECDRDNRKEIATWFQSVIDGVPSNEIGAIRCIFVSQDDGPARKDFSTVPSIKIMPSDNKDDMRAFAKFWHKRMEERFGQLHGNQNIANIIQARAQGMFLFGKLLAEYLHNQPSRERLLEELHPSKLPVKLDDAYSRIMQRITEKRPPNLTHDIWKVLGWIVCAPRPLKWREIQAAVCSDLENQEVIRERQLLDSPKDLFEALVEVQPNGTVELIHGSAREYLIRSNVVATSKSHFILALTSVGYLTFPELDLTRKKEESENDILEGRLAFLDYASACWAIHLQAGLPNHDEPENLVSLIETLEAFIDLHWSSNAKSLAISNHTRESLETLSKSESFDKILQAVGWSKKQLSKSGQGPSEDEALDLSRIILHLRTILERFNEQLAQDEKERLQRYYGTKWFKCPRVSCFFYHEGFNSIVERNHHVSRHERPFMCIVNGCHMATFGCVTENDLKAHLFDYHGIDFLDDTEFPEPKKPANGSSKRNASYGCHLCTKKFTRQFNLRSHLRTHNEEKPFVCSYCEMKFTRRSDCLRHEIVHGEKKLKCSGPLEDGTSWGCGKLFSRGDKLGAHLRSKTGQKCIRSLITQVQNKGEPVDGNGSLARYLDLDIDTRKSAVNELPTFAEFLRRCGQNESGKSDPSNCQPIL